MLRYTSSEANPFDAQLAHTLEQDTPSLFVEFTVSPVSPSDCEVLFEVTRMVSLHEHLKRPLGERELKDLFVQFAQLLETCASRKLPLKNIEFDAKHIYYDSWSSSVKFVYLPFAGIPADVRAVQSFFVGVSAMVREADPGARTLLKAYREYFQHAAGFNPADFQSFLYGLAKERKVLSSPPASPSARRTQEASAKARPAKRPIHAQPASPLPGAKKAPATQRKATTNLSNGGPAPGKHVRLDPGTGVLDAVDWHTLIVDGSSGKKPSEEPASPLPAPEKSKPKKAGPILARAGRTTSLPSNNPPKRDPHPGTTVLDGARPEAAASECAHPEAAASEGSRPETAASGGARPETTAPVGTRPETTVLGSPAAFPARLGAMRFWLTRVRTGERFELRGDRFVVGKSKFSDYQVKDTTTISRSHAIFSCRGEDCLIEDDESKNGTYIDGVRLSAHESRPLADGAVVRMSDEDFTFEKVHC